MLGTKYHGSACPTCNTVCRPPGLDRSAWDLTISMLTSEIADECNFFFFAFSHIVMAFSDYVGFSLVGTTFYSSF